MAFIRSKIDLHSHSTASDGSFTPTGLVKRAIDKGLTHLALTDHDCILGIREAQEAARGKIELIPGSELSCTWRNEQIHVVGLFIDLTSEILLKYLEGQKAKRIERAVNISLKLEKQGIRNAYEECVKRAGEGASITRGNYAKLLVELGRAQDNEDAFNTYLKKGKSCYVKTLWPDMSECVQTILCAGGIPVLAHPSRYSLTNTKIRELMEDFKSYGGLATEVCGCQMRPTEIEYLCKLCEKYDFMASLGSDFHHEGSYRELGFFPPIPDHLKKVWDDPRARPYNFC
ncbi:MAG: PHP domain-containing protein [Succinivibrio sp.]